LVEVDEASERPPPAGPGRPILLRKLRAWPLSDHD